MKIINLAWKNTKNLEKWSIGLTCVMSQLFSVSVICLSVNLFASEDMFRLKNQDHKYTMHRMYHGIINRAFKFSDHQIKQQN